MLSRNQKSARTLSERDVTPDQRRKKQFFLVLQNIYCRLAIILLWFGYCQCLFSLLYFQSHLVIAGTRPQLTKKLAAKRARISSYLIKWYSLNTASDRIQYTQRTPLLIFLRVFWWSWTILRMMENDRKIQCILVNLIFFGVYTVETVVTNWIPMVRRIYHITVSN